MTNFVAIVKTGRKGRNTVKIILNGNSTVSGVSRAIGLVLIQAGLAVETQKSAKAQRIYAKVGQCPRCGFVGDHQTFKSWKKKAIEKAAKVARQSAARI